jgi:hypothetical protein
MLAGTASLAVGMATIPANGAPVAGATAIGPSTTTSPYVLPAADGVDITSLLTVNDDGAAADG